MYFCLKCPNRRKMEIAAFTFSWAKSLKYSLNNDIAKMLCRHWHYVSFICRWDCSFKKRQKAKLYSCIWIFHGWILRSMIPQKIKESRNFKLYQNESFVFSRVKIILNNLFLQDFFLINHTFPRFSRTCFARRKVQEILSYKKFSAEASCSNILKVTKKQ